MILGIDPLYIILVVIAAVAIGLAAMGFAMYKMIALLTSLLAAITGIQALLAKPSMHPAFTQSMIEQVESKLAALRLANKETSPAIVAELADAVAVLQQITVPLQPTTITEIKP